MLAANASVFSINFNDLFRVVIGSDFNDGHIDAVFFLQCRRCDCAFAFVIALTAFLLLQLKLQGELYRLTIYTSGFLHWNRAVTQQALEKISSACIVGFVC